LARTVAVLAVSLGITSFVAFHVGSLSVVAGVQVGLLAGWWLFNEWTLRDLTGETSGRWVKFLVFYGVVSASYLLITLQPMLGPGVSTLIYYVGVGGIAVLVCRKEFRMWRSTRLSVGN
jgi:hypothetical protein